MGQEAVDGFEYGSDTEASEQTQICQDLSSGLSEPTSSLKLSHACSFQLNLGRYAQSSSLVKSHEIQQSISKLSNSHIESITIMSRTEGKIEELSKITKGVQLAFQELAGRIANRVQESRLEDQQYVQHIEKTLQKLFSEHISGAVAKPSSEISIHNIALVNFMKPQPSDILGGRGDGKDIPVTEKASNYKTWLGEVYTRIVVMTYISVNEIAPLTFPSSIRLFREPIIFPITMTKTDVLLLPITWSPSRGVAIRCHQISGSSTKISDLFFEIRNFNSIHCLNDSSQRGNNDSDGGMSMRLNSFIELKEKLPKPSQSLLYTAFKAAFVARQACESRRYKRKQRTNRARILRSSFDHETNDIIELVYLWIHNGLEADFYQNAFHGNMTQTIEQSESLFQAGSRKTRSLQRLRHEYIFQLVVEMTARLNEEALVEERHIDSIHQYHWEQCQLLALSSTVGITMQWSSTYEIPWCSPVFVAAREGNISTLRRLFDARLASPFDCTIARASVLENALASSVGILVRWYDEILFKDAAKILESDGEKIGNLSQYWFERRQSPQSWLKKFFDTIDFPICLGLRPFGAPHEFKTHFRYKIIINDKATFSPHWARWPWEARDGTPHSSCWSNDSLVANFMTLDYYLKRACVQPDGLNWIEKSTEIDGIADFDLKEYLLEFSWLSALEPDE